MMYIMVSGTVEELESKFNEAAEKGYTALFREFTVDINSPLYHFLMMKPNNDMGKIIELVQAYLAKMPYPPLRSV